jgi:L-threonylcarbamoyladenylate synthase
MSNIQENDLENALLQLQKAGVILCPTDTIWGLSCDASNSDAAAKIYDIKKRPQGKSFVVLVSDVEMLKNYVGEISEEIHELLNSLETPTSIIYPEVKNIAFNVKADDGSVAIRVVKNDFCHKLIAAFGKAIVSTSANFSGEPSPAFFSEINPLLINEVDYVVKHAQEDVTPKSPSSIYKVSDGAVTRIR